MVTLKPATGNDLFSITQMSKIAIIGCGAIAEKLHLPFLCRNGWRNNLALVDTNKERLRCLSSKFHLDNPLLANDYRQLPKNINGVIIASPHKFHYQMSIYFIKQGMQVLCEKPLAETGKQVKRIIMASERTGARVAVNNTRRLYPSYLAVKKALENKLIGDLRSIEFHEGYKFNWPTVSSSYFQGKKGVLLDLGAHVVDTVCWWIGKPTAIDYHDDSFGGCEAISKLSFKIGQCFGKIYLSRLVDLKNRYIIRGTRGEISGNLNNANSFFITDYNFSRAQKIKVAPLGLNHFDCAKKIVNNFIDIVTKSASPLITPGDVKDSIEVIDYAYRIRKRLNLFQ